MPLKDLEKRKEYDRIRNQTPKRKAYRKNYNEEYRKNHSTIADKEANYQSHCKLHMKYRKLVMNHYSNGIIKCKECGESRLLALTIDHIEGNGNEHRKQLKNQGGFAFYKWLIDNNYPDGYQVLCFNCNIIKEFKEKGYYDEHFKGVTNHG